MSTYGNGCGCNNEVPPCNPSLPQQESVASQLDNLSLNLFGLFTVTIQNGRGVWSGLCSTNSSIPFFARNANEGFLCYILRYLTTQIGLNGSKITAGAGSPEGVVTGNPGDMYLNQSGGAGTTLYVKESGTSNTGWIGK